jgi:hypothetical protein
MADLRNNEVAVSEKNDSRMGPSGKKSRMRSSLYLLVGGSSDVYDVTVNFESKNGHWCQKESGARCHGNGNGKGQKYGPPQGRDKRNPVEWCKHVAAALADVEALAEAEDRTAAAFGEGRTATVTVKPAVPAFPETDAAADRLAALNAERDALLAEIAAEEQTAELRTAIAALIETHGAEAVRKAAA